MVDAGVALLRAPPEVLKNFRVIGVVGSVLLVVDTATEGSFVIKVLLNNVPIQSNSSMHHYECVALCKDVSLQGDRFCARSLASYIPRSSEDRSS